MHAQAFERLISAHLDQRSRPENIRVAQIRTGMRSRSEISEAACLSGVQVSSCSLQWDRLAYGSLAVRETSSVRDQQCLAIRARRLADDCARQWRESELPDERHAGSVKIANQNFCGSDGSAAQAHECPVPLISC